MKPPYILDTNSFRVLSNYYAAQFPTFWKKFDVEVQAQRIISVREVLKELEAYKSNWIYKKARSMQSAFLIPSGQQAAFVANLLSQKKYQAMVAKKNMLQGKPVADPFLVAAGFELGGSVVTEEKRKPNAVKIPNVCDDFSIRVVNVEEMLTDFGWSF